MEIKEAKKLVLEAAKKELDRLYKLDYGWNSIAHDISFLEDLIEKLEYCGL